MAKKDFKSDILDLRPDARHVVKGHIEKRNLAKYNLAMALRTLREKRNMTQKDVEAASGLPQPAISRLEAPTGSLPTLETVLKYVVACGGHMQFSFSEQEFDLDEESPSAAAAAAEVIHAVAV
ncbi:helix-turn-helix transcriptional regulator [Nisaea sp.]|uniref:helix-turn-helix domain-containing protein n=1 Tax=Nisaea sp. TaxID=2024842 RepID=UPI002B2783EA|nr:helix-turn-helix transcriptional regulator [Nisaea sp.]